MEGCGRRGRVVGRGSGRRRREAATGRGRGGEGRGGGCLPLRHFRSFALLEEAFPLAGAGYGSDGV